MDIIIIKLYNLIEARGILEPPTNSRQTYSEFTHHLNRVQNSEVYSIKLINKTFSIEQSIDFHS